MSRSTMIMSRSPLIMSRSTLIMSRSTLIMIRSTRVMSRSTLIVSRSTLMFPCRHWQGNVIIQRNAMSRMLRVVRRSGVVGRGRNLVMAGALNMAMNCSMTGSVDILRLL